MADVTPRRNDRGQLLIVAAVGLAILLVVLALSLNTAVYGEVHVTQTDDSLDEERGVLHYQNSVERGVAGLLPLSAGNETEYAELEDDFHEEVDTWDELSSVEHARDGVVTDLTVLGVTFENRISQDEHGTFEAHDDHSTPENWTVASGASDVGEFQMEIHDEDLADVENCTPGEDCFTLTVEGNDGNTWHLFAHTDPNTQTSEVHVEPSAGVAGTCEVEDGPIQVNVTGGTFEHEDCTDEFTSFVEDDGLEPPYSLNYTNADAVTGTYYLDAYGEVLDGTIEDDDRFATSGSPTIQPRIAVATLSVEYRSPSVTYRTELTVAAGEAHD